jgi:hypothetical protein
LPVLRELVRHMAHSRMLGEQLALLRHCSLTRHAKSRAIFAQLLALHRDQSMRIAALSTKLRLTPQTQEESRKRAAERRRTPTNAVRPWEDWGKRDDGDGQH